MCEVTGGRSYSIQSHKALNQCLESLVQKIQNGVVLQFEKIGAEPLVTNGYGSGMLQSCRQVVLIHPHFRSR